MFHVLDWVRFPVAGILLLMNLARSSKRLLGCGMHFDPYLERESLMERGKYYERAPPPDYDRAGHYLRKEFRSPGKQEWRIEKMINSKAFGPTVQAL